MASHGEHRPGSQECAAQLAKPEALTGGVYLLEEDVDEVKDTLEQWAGELASG